MAELKKDIQAQFDKLSDEKKAELPETKLGIFVGASSSPEGMLARDHA